MSEEAKRLGDVESLRADLKDPVIVAAAWEGRQIDPALQNIVHFFNQAGADIPITLSQGGSLVTGNLISADEYFDSIIEQFGPPSDSGDTIFDHFKALVASQRPEQPEPQDVQLPPQFIHLKDAQVLNGGSPIPGNTTLWRGKISSVDGFFFGKLTGDKN